MEGSPEPRRLFVGGESEGGAGRRETSAKWEWLRWPGL